MEDFSDLQPKKPHNADNTVANGTTVEIRDFDNIDFAEQGMVGRIVESYEFANSIRYSIQFPNAGVPSSGWRRHQFKVLPDPTNPEGRHRGDH